MKRFFMVLLAATACLSCFVSPAFSEEAKTEKKYVNDNNNYLGDKISFPVRLDVKDTENNKYCLPAGTYLRGLGKSDDDGLLVILNNFYFKGYNPVKDCKNSNEIPQDLPLVISKGDLAKYPFDRYGWTYGGLVVPYKYHFSGSKNFDGNATVGPYFGYRIDKNSYLGIGFKVIGFLGASAIKVNQNVDGKETEQSLAGFSYGGGILGEIKKEFQLGLVLGVDRVSSSSNYEDNEKLWGAISLGYSFSE